MRSLQTCHRSSHNIGPPRRGGARRPPLSYTAAFCQRRGMSMLSPNPFTPLAPACASGRGTFFLHGVTLTAKSPAQPQNCGLCGAGHEVDSVSLVSTSPPATLRGAAKSPRSLVSAPARVSLPTRPDRGLCIFRPKERLHVASPPDLRRQGQDPL